MGLLLRGGEVLDPGAKLAGALDVRVRRQGDFDDDDTDGAHTRGPERLLPVMTVKDGEVWRRA